MSNATTLAALNKLVRGLNASPAALTRGAQAATKEIRELVTEEFRSGTNPWGRPWAPRKDPRNPPLDATGELIDSIKIDLVGGEIQTKVGVRYARNLQRGRRRFTHTGRALLAEGYKRRLVEKQKGATEKVMRPRTILPFKALPPTWALAIASSIEGEIAKELAP